MAPQIRVAEQLGQEGPLAAPDVLVFEVLAVLRRDALRGALHPDRGRAGIEDLVALAQRLGEPLATKDHALAAAARRHAEVEVVELTTP